MKKTALFLMFFLLLYNCKKANSTLEMTKDADIAKDSCQINQIPIISEKNIDDIFRNGLLGDERIKKVNSIDPNTLFHESEKCMAKRLYFGKNIPSQAGKYENESPYLLFDLVYSNPQEIEIAFNNLKFELENQTKKIDNIQFDYFKGSTYLFYLNKSQKKITISVCSPIPDLKNYNKMMDFARKNKSRFDEILLGTPTGLEIIK